MFSQIVKGLALGGAGYLLYKTLTGANVTTASNEGAGLLNGLFGELLNTGYQAAAVVNGGEMEISLKGLAHIKGWEGFRDHVYLDEAGLPTIGYGHLLKPHERYEKITEAEATRLLAKDVTSAEAAVNKGVKVKLTQGQFDALVSFAFNVGNGAFLSSTLLKRLNEGSYLLAQQQFTKWVYVTRNGKKFVSDGLVNRRLADARLFAGLATA